MNFDLSAEHDAFREVVRSFAEAEIAPHASQWDEDHHFPVDVVMKMPRQRNLLELICAASAPGRLTGGLNGRQ